ncbi:MAG TPA: dual specificity protein phosphatase family protein [Steroidobacteraceae bacterium]|nr:dual specificity protein phosphatase family protein [Steroidobacteraceae bacterium]
MNKIFWLQPGRIAGRTGPDTDPWDLGALRAAGVGAVLSVNEGLACVPEDFARHDLQYRCVPLAANAPPEPGDHGVCVDALPRAHAFVTAQLAQQRAVLVHCTLGRDRTGLYLAYYLLRETGVTPHRAIELVRRVRPNALAAAGWDNFAREVLAQFARQPTSSP